MRLDPTIRTPTGMVCTVDQLASTAGADLLAAGGTAADAAIGANAVLAVTSPHYCGLGGDLFAMVHRREGPPEALDAAGRAGSGADPARLVAAGHDRIPLRGDVSAVTVPGCVDGWVALHERHGRLPLADVLAPAIGYAERGFPATPILALAVEMLDGVAGAEELTDRRPLRAGSMVRRPGHGRLLRAVADGGRDAFYGGELGEGLVELGRRHGGEEFTAADLDAVQARWVEPLGLDLWGHRVWTVPAPSQGYLTLLGAAVAAGLPLPDDPRDPAWAHLLVEAARAAGHDRPDLLHEDAALAPLLEPDEVDRRRALVDPERRGRLGLPGAAGDTMHLCVVDAEGCGVSLIQSNASGFGAHLAVGSTGVLVHDRGIGFSLEPGHPARYGPGRRPPHTLSPALVTRDGSLTHVLGTMGGDSQPQILLQLLVRMLALGESPGEAVSAPRWVVRRPTAGGFDAWDDVDDQEVAVEDAAAGWWRQGLEDRGHRVVVEAPLTQFGHAHAIGVHPDHLAGLADPRAVTGAAVGR